MINSIILILEGHLLGGAIFLALHIFVYGSMFLIGGIILVFAVKVGRYLMTKWYVWVMAILGCIFLSFTA